MVNNLGYQKNLFILPFDHRSSFIKLFGFTGPNLFPQDKEVIAEAKGIIYSAFKMAVEREIPKEQAAILVDEEFGDKIIRDAKNLDYNVVLAAEKSGQSEFSFEYGDSFAQHIDKYKPYFVKALIRYKPGLDCKELKILSDYCRNSEYKFMIEVLTDNKTEAQTLTAINALQNVNIEPDIWKLEGMENEKEYENIVSQAQNGNRQNVKVVILGKGENQETVEKWIEVGARVKGIIGFAVGRTIFWKPLSEYKDGEIDKEKTIELICSNFLHFYHLFMSNLIL